MTTQGSSGSQRASLQRCPRCGSRDLRRSATRQWEWPVRWLTDRVPFRCRSCDYRCWGFEPTDTQDQADDTNTPKP